MEVCRECVELYRVYVEPSQDGADLYRVYVEPYPECMELCLNVLNPVENVCSFIEKMSGLLRMFGGL